MRNKLVIIGANGHGKVVADIALATRQYKEIVFLCNFERKTECMGYPIVGKNEDAISFVEEADFMIAIGESEIRRTLMEKLMKQGAHMATLVHPSAIIGSRVEIGVGTVVMPGVVINAEARIGKGCIVNTASSVDHGCVLEDYTHVAVGAHLCGLVSVGTNTWIGAGATVINGVHICGDCIIGAGAVVIKNIKESGTYVGVPAKRSLNREEERT